MVYLISGALFLAAAGLIVFIFIELNSLEQDVVEVVAAIARHFDTGPKEFLN